MPSRCEMTRSGCLLRSRPCLRHRWRTGVHATRVTLRTVLASLAEGASTAEILADFPTLSEEDVRAAIASAATSAQGDFPLAEPPIKR